MINRFEQPILQKMLGPARRRVGAPSRPRKGRPPQTHVPVPLGTPQVISKVVNVPNADYPVMFIGLRLKAPKLFSGLPIEEDEKVEGWGTIDRDSLEKLGLADGTTFHVGAVSPYSFAQLLAKIAHGYAIGELGYGTFKPLLMPILRGEAKNFVDLVGGDYEIPPRVPDQDIYLQMFHTELDGSLFHSVRIRLWGWLGTPVYHVVAGVA
jgi:hypothetical protein